MLFSIGGGAMQHPSFGALEYTLYLIPVLCSNVFRFFSIDFRFPCGVHLLTGFSWPVRDQEEERGGIMI